MSPMNDLSARALRLAGALDLLKTMEGPSVPEADHSAPLIVPSEAFVEAASPVEVIVLGVSPMAIPSVAFLAVVTPSAASPVAVTSVAAAMAEVADNQAHRSFQERTLRASLF